MRFVNFIFLLVLSSSVHTVFSLEDKFVKAANCFSLQLMQKMEFPDGNGIMSAFSVDTVLSMLMLGARGKTADELNSVLQNEANDLSIQDVKQDFLSVMESLTSNKDVTVSIANAMWTDKGYSVKDDYKNVIQYSFMADQRSGDFNSNPAKATDDINTWVKAKTNSMIDKLFDKPLDSTTIMVLLNAIYFKGEWLYKFEQVKTRSEEFYNGGDKTTFKMVDFMNQKTWLSFKRLPEMKAKALRLDYKGESMSFVAFLPDEGVSLADVEKKVNCDSINNLLEFNSMYEVDIKLPKFEITSKSEENLKKALIELGLGTVFGGGDFSGIGPGDLELSKILQKAKIKVDEEGSEAAAATEAQFLLAGPNPPVQRFWANRPFCFFIVDKESGLILFGGKLIKL